MEIFLCKVLKHLDLHNDVYHFPVCNLYYTALELIDLHLMREPPFRHGDMMVALVRVRCVPGMSGVTQECMVLVEMLTSACRREERACSVTHTSCRVGPSRGVAASALLSLARSLVRPRLFAPFVCRSHPFFTPDFLRPTAGFASLDDDGQMASVSDEQSVHAHSVCLHQLQRPLRPSVRAAS